MYLTTDKITHLLANLGVVITNSHIVYTSGKHGSAYVNKDAIYPHTRETSELCFALADRITDIKVVNDVPLIPKAVVAPAVGGVILSQWTAHHLSGYCSDRWMGIPALYADKVGDGFVIKRGYEKIVAGKKTLVVEDILNTGGSALKTVEAVRKAGGDVVAVGALCNRGGVTAEELGVPHLVTLLDVKMDAWDAAECPLCAQGVPINTSVGHGAEFLARKK